MYKMHLHKGTGPLLPHDTARLEAVQCCSTSSFPATPGETVETESVVSGSYSDFTSSCMYSRADLASLRSPTWEGRTTPANAIRGTLRASTRSLLFSSHYSSLGEATVKRSLLDVLQDAKTWGAPRSRWGAARPGSSLAVSGCWASLP